MKKPLVLLYHILFLFFSTYLLRYMFKLRGLSTYYQFPFSMRICSVRLTLWGGGGGFKKKNNHQFFFCSDIIMLSMVIVIRGSEFSISLTLIISSGRLIFVVVVTQVYFYNIPDDVIDSLV